jgi:hypothetical protein
LRASAGHGAVTRNLTEALVACLDATTLAVVRLVTSRDELRERLRPTTPTGIPLLAEMTKAIASYRTAERGLGRIELAADVDQRALILIATPICCSPARKTSRRAPRSAES